ncbi:MAG: diaminopimelate epimerase [Gloeobacterales cyanobacterium]
MIPFTKYQGLGNDFVLIDNRAQHEPMLSPAQARQVCDRNFGVGGDGVIFLLPSISQPHAMRIFNNDGSEAQMCGNGIRCLAKFMRELNIPTEEGGYSIETKAGLIVPRFDGEYVTVDMGPPRLRAEEIPTTLVPKGEKVLNLPLPEPCPSTGSGRRSCFNVTMVSMGNPHAVIFVDDLKAVDLANWGPAIESHPAFPERTNVHFVHVLNPTYLNVKVWERGAGPTLACGTGACAILVAAVLNQKAEKRATVELPGGPLEIYWHDNDHVFMTGPAQKVFVGQLDL